jgi:hypothetical protein
MKHLFIFLLAILGIAQLDLARAAASQGENRPLLLEVDGDRGCQINAVSGEYED